jgi:hypothetical protein
VYHSGVTTADDSVLSDEDIRHALRAVRSDQGPELKQVLDLTTASLQRSRSLAPQAVIDAVRGVYLTDRDVANGGLDQFVWNHGIEQARKVAEAFRAVGALENADVLEQLAAELESYQREVGDEAIRADAVGHFLVFRRRGGGPYFAIPEIHEEVGESLIEYAIAHADDFADPGGPLARVEVQHDSDDRP